MFADETAIMIDKMNASASSQADHNVLTVEGQVNNANAAYQQKTPFTSAPRRARL